MKQTGVFIIGLSRPTACHSWTCPFYITGDSSGPDYCKIQTAQGLSSFKTELRIEHCPLYPCEASPAQEES